MPRGQYDRAAAKAKRNTEVLAEQVSEAQYTGEAWTRTRMDEEGDVTVERIEPIEFTKEYLDHAQTDTQLTRMMDTHLRVADVQQPFVRPAWPYTNDPTIELQAKLDAANALLDRYKDLVKRNGLWLDE